MTLPRIHDRTGTAYSPLTMQPRAADLARTMQAENAAWDALRRGVAASPSAIDALHRALRAVREERG